MRIVNTKHEVHATMAIQKFLPISLAKILGDMKKTPQDIRTNATLTMAQRDGGWKITKIHLVTEATGEGIDDSVLNQAAKQAKDQCPVSVLLKPGLEELTLEVRKASR